MVVTKCEFCSVSKWHINAGSQTKSSLNFRRSVRLHSEIRTCGSVGRSAAPAQTIHYLRHNQVTAQTFQGAQKFLKAIACGTPSKGCWLLLNEPDHWRHDREFLSGGELALRAGCEPLVDHSQCHGSAMNNNAVAPLLLVLATAAALTFAREYNFSLHTHTHTHIAFPENPFPKILSSSIFFKGKRKCASHLPSRDLLQAFFERVFFECHKVL